MSLRSRIGVTAVAFALVLAVDAALSRGGAGARGLAAVVGIGLGAACGVVLGALVQLVARVARRPLAAAEAAIAAQTTRDRAAPREPVIELHASVLAALAALVALVIAARTLLARARPVQDKALAETLTVVGFLCAVALAVPLFAGLRAALRRPIRALDANVSLPLPPPPWLGRVLYVSLPLGLVSAGLLARLGKTLGPFALPFLLLLVLAVAHALAPLVRSRDVRSPKARLFMGIAGALVVAAGLAGASHLLGMNASLRSAIEKRQGPRLTLALLRDVTDFDRDRASAYFGGGDCAPFDRAVHPAAVDTPGNGRDENCDGRDAAIEAKLALSGTKYFDGLDRANVRKHDVVWFIIDAVRADHASVTGYEKSTTPYIDALGKESLVFTKALSQSSATMLSIPSMLGGTDPGHMSWEKAHGKLQTAGNHVALVKRLRDKGYATGFVASEYFKKNLPSLVEGYETVTYHSGDQLESAPTAAVQAAAFIQDARRKKAPFFLTVYLVAPHAPYVKHTEGYPDFGTGELADYDSEIAAADRYVGFVLDALRESDKDWKKTVVIVNSDHGEEFNEHGGAAHARTCHIESVHVPLVVRIPGVSAKRVASTVALVDVVPTLIEVLGLERPRDEELDGQSLLVPTLAPSRLTADRPIFCSVVSQKAAQGLFFRRSVRSGKWTLLQELTGAPSTALYDSGADPGEQKPLGSGQAPAVRARLIDTLAQTMTGNIGSMELTAE